MVNANIWLKGNIDSFRQGTIEPPSDLKYYVFQKASVRGIPKPPTKSGRSYLPDSSPRPE